MDTTYLKVDKMRNLLILFLIPFLSGNSFGQVTISNPDDFIFINDTSLNYYCYISKKPVTNLDYLTYLCWINDIYCDYPVEMFINAFPSLNIDSLSSSQIEILNGYYFGFEKLIMLSNNDIVNRLFKCRYANYPVLGLSKQQIYNFNKWLTDRYNEYYAIKKGVFQWDPSQIGPENFTTESYLNGQYEGLINRNIKDKKTKQFRRINWSDNYFIPTFRLPTQRELSLLNVKIEYKEYDSFSFLAKWSDYYIKCSKDGLTIKIGNMEKLLLNNYTSVDTDMLNNFKAIQEYTCSTISDIDQLNLFSIYQDLGQVIADENILKNSKKDYLGHFPIQIIYVDNNEPVYATPPSKDGYILYSTFRLVINELK